MAYKITLTNLGTFVVILLHLSTVMLHPARPTLPLCTEEKGKGREIQLHCIVFAGQYLDYDEVRKFTGSRIESEKFNVSISCFNGGKIRLPWPFFANNVLTLHVSDCVNEGFLSERFDPQIYSNELQQVMISNIRNKIELNDFVDTLRHLKNMSTHFDCGQTNASVLILRNMEYIFPPLKGTMDELLVLEELMSTQTIKHLLSHNSVCHYDKLQYLEESGSRSFSAFHMKLMETSKYPRLGVYSLRNNSLTSVPVELEHMQSSFLPKLSVLDLSDNQIVETNFMFSGHSKKNLLINLKRNQIKTISKNQLTEIQNSGGVIFDIRDNPLYCSCELFKYGDYLSGLAENKKARKILNEAKCKYEQNGNLQNHFITAGNIRNQLCTL